MDESVLLLLFMPGKYLNILEVLWSETSVSFKWIIPWVFQKDSSSIYFMILLSISFINSLPKCVLSFYEKNNKLIESIDSAIPIWKRDGGDSDTSN